MILLLSRLCFLFSPLLVTGNRSSDQSLLKVTSLTFWKSTFW